MGVVLNVFVCSFKFGTDFHSDFLHLIWQYWGIRVKDITTSDHKTVRTTCYWYWKVLDIGDPMNYMVTVLLMLNLINSY